MNVIIGIFIFSSISTFGLLELILFLQRDTVLSARLRIFRIVTWFVGVAGLMSPLLVHMVVFEGLASNEFRLSFIVWAVVFNLYLFSRFFKRQAYAGGG